MYANLIKLNLLLVTRIRPGILMLIEISINISDSPIDGKNLLDFNHVCKKHESTQNLVLKFQFY